MGEPAGISGDLVLASWYANAQAVAKGETSLPPFYIIDNAQRLITLAAHLQLDVPISRITTPADAIAAFPHSLPVFDIPQLPEVISGTPTVATAPYVIDAIKQGVTHCIEQQAAGLVTLPIHKAVLQDAGFAFPGHTEFLSALTNNARPLMMLTCANLRVIPLTIHCSLKDVFNQITEETVFAHLQLLHRCLQQDFNIRAPRIAVAGLNPHAGEDGKMGQEEQHILRPAIALACKHGITALGPFPADTMFHAAARSEYDAALCMYHDQALIPLKTIDFFGGVNVTLNLPIVRTSPDHGTALSLSGTGTANSTSFCNALKMAAQIARTRSQSAFL
jgi:4-hydroxythreonine-4-phosphate dehydrogenase